MIYTVWLDWRHERHVDEVNSHTFLPKIDDQTILLILLFQV